MKKEEEVDDEESPISLRSFAPIRWNAINFSLYAEHAHRRKVDLTSSSSTWPYCDAPFSCCHFQPTPLPFGYPSENKSTTAQRPNETIKITCVHYVLFMFFHPHLYVYS